MGVYRAAPEVREFERTNLSEELAKALSLPSPSKLRWRFAKTKVCRSPAAQGPQERHGQRPSSRKVTHHRRKRRGYGNGVGLNQRRRMLTRHNKSKGEDAPFR